MHQLKNTRRSVMNHQLDVKATVETELNQQFERTAETVLKEAVVAAVCVQNTQMKKLDS